MMKSTAVPVSTADKDLRAAHAILSTADYRGVTTLMINIIMFVGLLSGSAVLILFTVMLMIQIAPPGTFAE